MKVTIRPRLTEEQASDGRSSLGPWVKAGKEEEERREEREKREEESAQEARERLNRKLGRRKPLFRRIR